MSGHVVLGEATIAAGASLSGAVEVNDAIALWIEVPTWTESAAITFQGQRDGGATFYEAHDELGEAIQLPAGTHNKLYPVPALVGLYAIKVRSGTTAAAQNQTAAETITVFGLR